MGDIPGGLARLAHRSLLMSSRATQGGRPSVFRQLDTVRAHARHHLSEVGETAVSLERHSRVRQLLAARPRLGDPSEVGWYDAIDDTSSIVRATLQTAVRADPDFRLLRVGSQLIYYWYYRRRVIEARHWLEDVLATIDAPATGEAGSVEVTMARLALAGVSLPAGRVDPAVPLIDAALQSLEWIPADLLLEVGELLIAVADTGWAKNEFAIVARLSAALNEIALISGDPLLLLMADKVDCESGLPTREFAVTAARAEELYERGKSIGNLLVQWEACGMRQIVCVLSDDPVTGIIWVDRLIATYLPLGDGGGGAFLEALANFAALTGDAETSVPLYAA